MCVEYSVQNPVITTENNVLKTVSLFPSPFIELRSSLIYLHKMEGHSDCCMQNNFHTPKNTNGNKIIIKNTNIPFGPNDIFMVLVSFAHVSVRVSLKAKQVEVTKTA